MFAPYALLAPLLAGSKDTLFFIRPPLAAPLNNKPIGIEQLNDQ
jgi:hypothetical protein